MLPQIEYSGIVWALSHNDPEPLVEHSIKKLQDYGIKKEDMNVEQICTMLFLLKRMI